MVAAAAIAQPMGPDLRDWSSVVKIITPGGRVAPGSGVVVHPRGYVLTSFGVVGETTTGSSTLPGTLHDSGNRYILLSSDSPATRARPRWIAEVVRGHVRLDLALLRIVSDVGGRALSGARFRALASGDPRLPRQRSSLQVLGFRAGQGRPNAVPGALQARRRDALGQLASIRLAAPFDRGLEGGGALDAAGRLVAIASSGAEGRLTPVSVVPAEWRTMMARGERQELQVQGLRTLEAGQELHEVAANPTRRETHFFKLGQPRPESIQIRPGLMVDALDRKGRRLRRSRGALQLRDLPNATMLAVYAERSSQAPLGYVIQTMERAPAESDPPPARVARTDRRPSSAEALIGLPSGGFFADPTESWQDGHRVRGRLIDSVSGRPVANGRVVIGRGGVRLRAHLSRYLRGQMTERTFREPLVGRGRANVLGQFEMLSVPPGAFPAAAFASGYRSAHFEVVVPEARGDVNIGTIQLVR